MKAGGAAQAHVAARPPADRGPPLLLLQLGALKLGDPESLTTLESILRLIGTQYHSEASLVLSNCDHLHQHALIHWVMQSLGHPLPHPIPNPSPYPPPPPQRSSSDITIDSPCSIHGSEEDRFAPSGREGGRGRLRGAAVSASAASSLSSRGGRFVIVSLLYSWNDEQMRRRRRSGNKNH